MWWSSLPKIEECRPRPSLLRTNDWTRGPLGVFVRQNKSVPYVIPTVRHRHKQGRFMYCNLASLRCLFEILLCLLIRFPCLLSKSRFCRFSFKLLPC